MFIFIDIVFICTYRNRFYFVLAFSFSFVYKKLLLIQTLFINKNTFLQTKS